jgi:hypothetical protein
LKTVDGFMAMAKRIHTPRNYLRSSLFICVHPLQKIPLTLPGAAQMLPIIPLSAPA